MHTYYPLFSWLQNEPVLHFDCGLKFAETATARLLEHILGFQSLTVSLSVTANFETLSYTSNAQCGPSLAQEILHKGGKCSWNTK